jgi:hypothetical protein
MLSPRLTSPQDVFTLSCWFDRIGCAEWTGSDSDMALMSKEATH